MIGFLYPEVCNQQGDQGYKDWLDTNQIETCVIEDERVDNLTGVVVGDVSEEGAILLESKLENHWLGNSIAQGLTVLAIGRAGQVLSKHLEIEPKTNSHKSQYVSTVFKGEELFGYVNGLHDLNQPITETEIGKGRLISCALLGPVAVVNPWFEEYCFGIKTSARNDLADHYKKLLAD